MNMKETFLKYGLSEKEVEIYLTCLKTGESTTNRLAELTSIRRSTVYEVIETLKKKGLISSFVKGKKSYFVAAKPSTLVSLLREKEESIREILPNLNALGKLSLDKPNVEIYNGILAIKPIFLSMLDSCEILVYGASILGDKAFGTFTANFARKRLERKVLLKAVIGETVPEHMTEKDVEKITEIKKLNMFEDYHVGYFVWGSKVLILGVKEPYFATLIESEVLAESQKKLFEYLWKIAKK
jgi:sugar-specific transcriptional regulator TrmB